MYITHTKGLFNIQYLHTITTGMKMKKIIALTACTLLATGCSNDVDLVKNGVMDFNQTTTLGKALDNWSSCDSTSWDSFETDNGVRVVEFTCDHHIDDFFKKAKRLLEKSNIKEVEHFDVEKNIHYYQFTLNQDNTFQFDNAQSLTTWKNGKTYEDSIDGMSQLERAYRDERTFNPDELNSMSAGYLSMMLEVTSRKAK
jgi:hypothetical protein